jgi:hypothetical protein
MPAPQPGVIVRRPGVVPAPEKDLQIAAPRQRSENFDMIAAEIIRSIVPEDYHKRVSPLTSVLMEYSSYPRRVSRVK